jgi:outer membrane receptor protein involved in Fe transport
MWRRIASTLLLSGVLATAVPARAGGYAFPVDVRAQPLSSALKDFARQTGIELLFDRDLMRGRQAPRLRGRYPIEIALQRLLEGTDLTTRRSNTGAWLIERRPQPEKLPPDELAAPDILVVGYRTQNLDIRRRENDVQPYRIVTGAQIIAAHRDNLDQYFRSRVTANTAIPPPDIQADGRTNSTIDLRGLGADGTLVLVDGRRMPSLPASAPNNILDVNFGFGQADVNAIPLYAIDRVETLTGTAGGIYGFGALGGVVNVVLKRDYRGFDLHGTAGTSTRGDAGRLSLEGRFGFTPDDGQTDVMVDVSYARSQPLLQGQRDYTARGKRLNFRYTPEQLAGTPSYMSNAVAVSDPFSASLILKPEYGGAALGSNFTYLPVGFAGTTNDLVTALRQHAGQLSLVPSEFERSSQLGSNATTTSIIFNVRHRFSDQIEGYFDALILRDHGQTIDRVKLDGVYLSSDSPDNPFDNFVQVTFPAPAQTRQRTNFNSQRFTAGVIASLPRQWKMTAEATFGGTDYSYDFDDKYLGSFPAVADVPAPNPLGNWDAFLSAASAYRNRNHDYWSSHDRYREQSLRLAGPIIRTAAGAATLTLLAEHRDETVPAFVKSYYTDAFGDPETDLFSIPSRSTDTKSLYAELRAPIFGDSAPFPLVKRLELQLAIRYDDLGVDFSRTPRPGMIAATAADVLHARFAAVSYTVGAKVSPLPWLMVRASFATGREAPPLNDLIGSENLNASESDPKRIGDFFGYLSKYGGSPDLKTVEADTLSVGVVFNPFGDNGPRFSLDYSRIRRTRDPYFPSEEFILAHEDLWPGRVTRSALTDEDRALGYTGGRITMIDTRAMNAGGLLVETLDGRVDWAFPLLTGTFRINGSATVQLRNALQAPFGNAVDYIDYYRSPLRWRANGGVEWTIGTTSIGANLQFFGRYKNYPAAARSFAEPFIEVQGSKWVHAQAYLDMSASHRFRVRGPGGDHQISLDFGIVNLLDHAAPYEGSPDFLGPQYSQYGDPRGRRFELTLSTSL